MEASVPEWSVALMLYNEERTVEQVILRTQAVLESFSPSHEIVVVDDGSRDGSVRVVEALSGRFGNIRLMRHETNLGIGATLRDCWFSMRGKIRGVLCSDMQFDPMDLRRIHEVFARDERVDFVHVLRGETRHDHPGRKLISKLDERLMALLFDACFVDIHWIKFMRKELFESMHLISKSPFLDAEMLILAKRAKASIVTLPLPQHPRAHGQGSGASVRHLWETLRDLFYFLARSAKNR